MSSPAQVVEVSGIKKPEDDEDNRVKQEILDEAHERFRICSQHDQAWRKRATEELNFVDKLDHWSADQKEERKGRPCLVFDRIGPSIDQVVNDARQNPPEPRITPVGSGADKHTAEILQGLIRNIDNDSSADIAYMTGYEHAVKIGRGWWRVLFVFEDDNGDDESALWLQKLLVKRIANPFCVYPDPAAEEFDYSDMRYCFVTEDLDISVFEELYPENYAGTGEFQGLSDTQRDDWFPKGAVRVAEYWRVLTHRQKMALLGNGRSMPLEDVPEGANIISTRWVEKRAVECHKITGAQVLETTVWPGKWIPLIACLGREVIEDGKRSLRGMVRPAMDANLSYDYMRSKQVEAIGLAPLSPWVAYENTIEGHETKWAEANRKAHNVLYVKAVAGPNNELLPPPSRLIQEPPIEAITIAVQHADNDIKSTLSTYDASLGNAGPESSGKAILARQREGDNAHFHYHDNLARSMRHTARIILDLVPHVYSEERIISMFDPDGSARQVWANKPFEDKDGTQRHYKLAEATRYDVVPGSGPSYATRRKEGQSALMELMRVAPQQMTRALDLVIKAIDAPFMEDIADRVRPQDIQQQKDGEVSPAQQLQQAQGLIQQQVQMIQALSGEMQQLTEMIKTDRLKLESQERIATQGNLTRIAIADEANKSKMDTERMNRDHDAVTHSLDTRLDLLHIQQTVEQDARENELAERQHQLEAQQAQQQQAQQQPEPGQ